MQVEETAAEQFHRESEEARVYDLAEQLAKRVLGEGSTDGWIAECAERLVEVALNHR